MKKKLVLEATSRSLFLLSTPKRKARNEPWKTKFAWLLLVGWALMVPYTVADSTGTPNIQTWSHNGSFDTARECEASAARISEKLEAKNDKNAKLWVLAKCVPMDLIYKAKEK